jgi:AraC-like DNA-binding protein
MTIFAPLLGTLWRMLEAYGVNPRRVISEDVYTPDGNFRIGERIPYRIYNEILKKAIDLIDDPAAGLKSARYMHPSHLGALGYAWMASATLKTAVERAQRFSRMYDERADIMVSEERGVLKVAYPTDYSSPIPEMVADANLAALLTLYRFNFGNMLVPVYVRMCRSPPPDPKPWHDFFGVEVAFDQAENSLAISSQDATKQLTGSNPMLVALHEDVIKRQIAELDRSDILNRTLSTIMDQLPSGDVSEISVSKAMNMTTRTLHRKLREKGVSFRDLLTNVRKELVRRYLDEPTYSVTEISFLLGYADTSAFSRAFKRWHGMTPTEARGCQGQLDSKLAARASS